MAGNGSAAQRRWGGDGSVSAVRERHSPGKAPAATRCCQNREAEGQVGTRAIGQLYAARRRSGVRLKTAAADIAAICRRQREQWRARRGSRHKREGGDRWDPGGRDAGARDWGVGEAGMRAWTEERLPYGPSLN
jgi:hypothetical protein